MLDASLYVALAFAVLLGLAIYYGLPRRILQALDAQAAAIAKQLDDARELRDEAKEHLADARRREAAAEDRARAIKAQAEQLAQAKADEIAAAAAARLARLERQHAQRLRHQQAEAMRQLRLRSVEAALTAATQILEQELSDAQKHALCEDSLKRLESCLS